MALSFARSLRSIEADQPRVALAGVAAAAVVLGAWSAWLCCVPVTVTEVSDAARIEVERTAHPIAAPVGGQVSVSRLELGREVRAGEVLVELDTRALSLSLAEERALGAALDGKLGPLAAEIEAQKRELRDAEVLGRARGAEAGARARAAVAARRYAEGEAARQKLLQAEGLAPGANVARAEAEREERSAEADAARIVEGRVLAEGQGRESELRGKLSRLERELAEIHGARASVEARLASLAHAVEQRRVRAPVAGRIGEVAALPAGAVVKEGDRLAAIVTAGALRVVAEFPPAAAFGRIRPGQVARLRLTGFSWTQFGVVMATVQSVATEPREGKARVELTLLPDAASRIPVQHGLPGSVEIDVEREVPLTLVLRAAGQALGAGRGGGG